MKNKALKNGEVITLTGYSNKPPEPKHRFESRYKFPCPATVIRYDEIPDIWVDLGGGDCWFLYRFTYKTTEQK